VWVADITIDPPILLNKNQKYWLAVQGMFPFDDGMSDTLQTWWMNSRNNTESRGMTYRTNYGGYVFGGLPAWEPVNFDLNPFGSECAPVQRGNAGNPAPCAGVPANTRLDFAFALTGSKDPPGPPNNACVGVFAAPPNGFDGYYTYDSAGATTDGTDAGCTVNRDVWFHYVTTSSGVLTFETCDSGYDSAIAVYDYLLFAACPPPVASRVGCDGIACGDDGRVTRVVGPFEEFLIRVGGNGTAEGRGILHIGEGVVCGNPDGGDCFQPHGGSAAGLGCNDRACCEAVCMFDPVCCESLAIGWDAECVAIASEIGACSPGAPAGIYPGNADADGQIDLLSGSTSACCPPVGCGGCQLHGDIAPLPAARCLIDVDDLLCALDGFSGTGPAACQAASDIAGCGPNGVVDVDDILTVLAAFSGIFDCPAPCPPGACIGNFPGGPVGTKCRDGDPLGAFFVENGMSESDCCALGGTYCGDCTFCGGSCTGSSICPSPP